MLNQYWLKTNIFLFLSGALKNDVKVSCLANNKPHAIHAWDELLLLNFSKCIRPNVLLYVIEEALSNSKTELQNFYLYSVVPPFWFDMHMPNKYLCFRAKHLSLSEIKVAFTCKISLRKNQRTLPEESFYSNNRTVGQFLLILRNMYLENIAHTVCSFVSYACC